MFLKSDDNQSEPRGSRCAAIILMYHRINDLRPDPWTLCVSPNHFAEQLAVARELTNPVSLQQFARGDFKPSDGKPLLAVTFDDGYADNFKFAKPLLEKHKIPATVFVTANRIGARREFWWDELERIFLQPNVLPQTLQIRIGDEFYQCELGANAIYERADSVDQLDWNCIGEDNRIVRQKIYRDLFDLIKPLPTNAQPQILDELFAWANSSSVGANQISQAARADRRMMNRTELVELARSEFVEIGAHTLTHPVLSALNRAGQVVEISESKRVLEQMLAAPVNGFAYPNGFPSDYTCETVEIVRAAGFEFACAAFDEPLTSETNVFELPRVMIRDWNGATFRQVLQNYFGK